MKESVIQTSIMNMLLLHKSVAWCFVTTTGKLRGRGGHWITLGYPGVADIIGQLKDGRLFALEVKTPGEKPTKVQQEFLNFVNAHNGVAACVSSAEEANKAISG